MTAAISLLMVMSATASFGKSAAPHGTAGGDVIKATFDDDIAVCADTSYICGIGMNGGRAVCAAPCRNRRPAADSGRKKVAGRLMRDGRGVAGAEIFYTSAEKNRCAVTGGDGRFEMIAEGEAIMIIGVRRDRDGAVEPLPVAVAASSETEVSITMR